MRLLFMASTFEVKVLSDCLHLVYVSGTLTCNQSSSHVLRVRGLARRGRARGFSCLTRSVRSRRR